MWLVVAFLAASASPSNASFENGNDLLSRCSTGTWQEGYCAGYIAGIADRIPGSAYEDTICMVPTVSLRQMRNVFLSYMGDKP